MKPDLNNSDHNGFVQDYLSLIMKHTEEMKPKLPTKVSSLNRDIGAIECAIELVQEYYGEGNPTGWGFECPATVPRNEAIHMLFAKLEEQLTAINMMSLASNINTAHTTYRRIEGDILSGAARITEGIPNEDLATWIDG